MLSKQIQEEIFVGHGVTNPLLFGIKTPGELGGKNQLLESLAVFQSTYVNKVQNTIEKHLNKLAKFSGAEEELILKNYEIDFSSIESETPAQKDDMGKSWSLQR